MNWDDLIETVANGGACKANAASKDVTAEQVQKLLAAAPPDQDSGTVLKDADFSGVTFVDAVRFLNVRFTGDASFKGAVFRGDAAFSLLRGDRCCFEGASFASEIYVDGWSSKRLDFSGCTFAKLARFYRIEAEEYLWFNASTFEGRTVFSDIRVLFSLSFNAARFSERVKDFVAGCVRLELIQARLERGGVFYLHGGEVDLSAVEFGASMMIAGTRKSGQFHNLDESLVVDGGDWRPRLLYCAGADIEKLVLQDVNLTRCEFERSINLERLRLEGLCDFDKPPKGLHNGADPPFIWFWTPRQSVVEERIWRSQSRKPHGWRPYTHQFPWAVPGRHERQEQAEQLAKVYRALRKGREDAKNEPGAADFYYGEMEMRRAGNATPAERFVLWLYWIVSGYGLRPLRTLVALLILLMLSSYLLMHHGFADPRAYPQALLTSLGATVNVEYLKPEAFTQAGQWIRIVLKILGPTLFGVLLLAFWGRVKR